MSLLVVVVLVACRRQDAPIEAIAMPERPKTAEEAPLVRTALVGPTVFSGAGLVVDVPDGVHGELGAVRERLIVRLVDDDTRAELDVEAWPPGDTPSPPAACPTLYAGARHWRSFPALGPSEVFTCVPDAADAPITTRWVVRDESRTLVLTARLPPARAFEARRAIEELLVGIRRPISGDGG